MDEEVDIVNEVIVMDWRIESTLASIFTPMTFYIHSFTMRSAPLGLPV